MGRFSCTFDEAQQFLVHNPVFSASKTRAGLWENLEQFLDQYLFLDDKYNAGGRLLDRMWLGGSFASDRVDPRNVDLTLFLDSEVQDSIKGNEGASLFKRSRGSFQRQFSVSPLVVPYRPVVHVFQMDQIDDLDRDYLADRGRWDDWWQRLRSGDPSDLSPTVATCRARRGYLEVIL